MIENKNQTTGLRGARPSSRWPQAQELFHTNGPDLQAAVELGAELKRLDRMVEDLAALKSTDDRQKLVNDLQDGMNGYGIDVGIRSYDIGYGDGWATGALTVLSMMLPTRGTRYPRRAPI